jgi:metal-sulfur cluster biosynthetic enzyme
MTEEEEIKKRLKSIIDPHTGMDIISMDLVKKIKVEKGNAVIYFTPTSPACPVTAYFAEKIKAEAEKAKGIKKAEVKIEF